MGGGVDIVEETGQYSSLSDELDEISFILLPITGNADFLNVYKLGSNIEKEILAHYKDLGIKCKSSGYAGGGGGGMESPIEILKILIQNWDLLSLIGSIIRVGRQYIVLSHQRKLQNSKPRFSISFNIHSDSMIDRLGEKEAGKILKRKLNNFLLITQSLINKLALNYTFLAFDVSVGGSLSSPNYIISLNIPDESRNSSLIPRYLNMINGSLKIRNNFRSNFSPTKWVAIKRTDSNLMDSSMQALSNKIYYLFLSSRVLKDYSMF